MCMDVKSPGPTSSGLVQDSYLVDGQETQGEISLFPYSNIEKLMSIYPFVACQKVATTTVSNDINASSDIVIEENPAVPQPNSNPIEYFDLTETVIEGGHGDKNRGSIVSNFILI